MVAFGSADSREASERRTAIKVYGMRLWFLYALLGGKSARRGLAIVAAVLAFFFYCFVHEAFDSPRRQSIVPVRYHPKPIKLGLPPSNWKPARTGN